MIVFQEHVLKKKYVFFEDKYSIINDLSLGTMRSYDLVLI